MLFILFILTLKNLNNLKEVLIRFDPYNIINHVDDEMHTQVSCKKQCDICTNFMVEKSNVSLKKEFAKLEGLSHVFPKMQFILHFV